MVMTEFCGILAQTINGVRSYALDRLAKATERWCLAQGAGVNLLAFRWRSGAIVRALLVLLLWTTVKPLSKRINCGGCQMMLPKKSLARHFCAFAGGHW